MKRKLTIVFIIFSIGIILGSISIFIIGKKADIKTNIQLDGVSSDIEHALYYASFAANSHNTQSWKLTLNSRKKELSVFLDKQRSLTVVDPNNRELYISIGCYLQSLQTAFEAYGYQANLTDTAPSAENHYQVAKMSYSKIDRGINDKQLDVIKKRHTDKRAFQTQALDSKIITKLSQKYENIHYYAKGSETFNYLQKKSIAAVTEQSKQQNFLDEQGQWLRFSNQEVQQKQDGISGDMLGLNILMKALYYLTSNHKNAASQHFAKQSISTLNKQVTHCAGFFTISGGQTIHDWIRLGRQTQSFWYDCVQNRIAIQPISAMIEVDSYNRDLQDKLKSPQPIQMILRAGYVKSYGENTGTRRDLKDYIQLVK